MALQLTGAPEHPELLDLPWELPLEGWLLNDLDSYRATSAAPGESEDIVAHDWVAEVFRPVVKAVPRELRGKLEQAEVFHEVLEHRWFLSEAAGHDIGLLPATASYVESVLRHKPDERALLDPLDPPGVPT